MKIRDVEIGYDQPTWFCAEISCNHLGSKALALELIQTAADIGCDSVKFQLYGPEDFDPPDEAYKDIYRAAYTPAEWLPELRCVAHGLGLAFIVSPFWHPRYVDVLEALPVDAYKVGFSEFYNVPMLERIRETGRPVIASTGMATWEEIYAFYHILDEAGHYPLAMLHCVSGYPTPADSMNLGKLIDMIEEHCEEGIGTPIGLSEHTTTTHFSLAAAVAGACIIERHLIKERNGVSPDNDFSLEPHEFGQLIREVREVEAAFSQCEYGILPCEQEFAWRKERSKGR